jgi:eukaryotic-like serine/threonine-protein kinase
VPERDDWIGAVLCDRFEIRELIGRGGIGRIYLAWQRSVKREVAIKLIDAKHATDPAIVHRFEREARLASQLSQPNTVSIFDFGRSDTGELFIAMELIRGRTLVEVLQTDGVFAVDRAVRIGSQICDALEAAHALGIIHRDLKPDNVIVLDQPAGRDLLKVLDFGLAKVFGMASSSSGSSGGMVGVPRYVAPETITAGRSQPAGDLYALGVILAELTLGRPLWEAEQLVELVRLKQDPAPAIAAVPTPLRRSIAALIDPDPERRPTPAQARALLRTLADGSLSFPQPVRPAEPAPVEAPRSRRWILVVALAALLLAAAAAVALVR